MIATNSSTAWLAVAESEEVERHLLACEAGALRIVLYRRRDGQPVALLDECWHRLLPLSNGSLEDDKIRCAYHGLIFDDAGVCVGARMGRPPAGAVVQSFPAQDAAGLVWILVEQDEMIGDDEEMAIGSMRSTLPL